MVGSHVEVALRLGAWGPGLATQEIPVPKSQPPTFALQIGPDQQTTVGGVILPDSTSTWPSLPSRRSPIGELELSLLPTAGRIPSSSFKFFKFESYAKMKIDNI